MWDFHCYDSDSIFVFLDLFEAIFLSRFPDVLVRLLLSFHVLCLATGDL